jgi:hypothetical protein
MSNISPKQFGPPTKSVPMPTKPPGMKGMIGGTGGTNRSVPMPTKPPGMKGMITGGTNRSVPMPTKPPSGGFSQGRMFNP